MEFFRNVSAEIVRACSGDNNHSSAKITHMIRSFIRSIITSNKFPRLKAIILNYEDFLVERIYFEELCSHSKKIERLRDELVVQNIKRCLESVRLINMVVRRIFALKSEPFNIHQIEHIESLQQLWHFLKASEVLTGSDRSTETSSQRIAAPPIASRNASSKVSSSASTTISNSNNHSNNSSSSDHNSGNSHSNGGNAHRAQPVQVAQVTAMVNVQGDWMELGFQGSDPSTDFRGMGILGLTQLLYFSQYKTIKARGILNDFSTKPTTGDSATNGCYFPFAIIGINITRFLLEIVDEKRVHDILIEHLGHTVCLNANNYHILPSDDEVCTEFGMKIIHEVYCTIFEEFYNEYVRVQPTTIMFFSMIFDNVKDAIRRKYLPIDCK